MPIYEYQCQACEHLFEAWQKMSDSPIRTCPACKRKRVERVVSRASFQLKGGGWYKDGYGSSPKTGSTTESKSSGTAAGNQAKT
jgi:putative FmdB family regulatory protein